MKKPTVKAKPTPKPRTVQKKTKEEEPQKENLSKNENKETKKVLVTAMWLSKALGVTDRRIRQLQQEGVIKPVPGSRDKDGAKYDFAETIISVARYYREKSDSRKSGDSEEIGSEKLKQITVKRKLEELKLAQLEGELHRVEDIERVMGAVLTRLRINLLAIPMGAAPVLRGHNEIAVIAGILEERITRALVEVVKIDLRTLIANETEVQEE